MNVNPLGSFSLQELWDEIQARHDAAVLITAIEVGKFSDDRSFFYHGGYKAIGLIEIGKRRIMDDYLESIGEPDNSEGGWDESEREV